MAFHRNTTISVILSTFSFGLSAYQYFIHPAAIAPGIDFRLVASVVALLAWFAVMSEFIKHASFFQLSGTFLSMLALGISVDHAPPFIPFFSIAMVLMNTLNYPYLRKWFSETDGLWIRPFLVMGSLGCYVFSNLHYDFGWRGWALPAIPLIMFSKIHLSNFMFGIGTLKYLKGKKQNIEIGKAAPHFSLPDKEGNTVSLSDYKDKQHVLLVFIRNDWCPSCRIKLRTYEQHREQFNSKNVQLLTISPSDRDADKDMTANLGIKFNVLYDITQETAKNYG